MITANASTNNVTINPDPDVSSQGGDSDVVQRNTLTSRFPQDHPKPIKLDAGDYVEILSPLVNTDSEDEEKKKSKGSKRHHWSPSFTLQDQGETCRLEIHDHERRRRGGTGPVDSFNELSLGNDDLVIITHVEKSDDSRDAPTLTIHIVRRTGGAGGSGDGVAPDPNGTPSLFSK